MSEKITKQFCHLRAYCHSREGGNPVCRVGGLHPPLQLPQGAALGLFAVFLLIDVAGLPMYAQRRTVDPNESQSDNQSFNQIPFEESYSLFSGGRAVGEKIQLDRTLQAYLTESRAIDISAVEEMTTAHIDWKAPTSGDVKKDPLARYIPADQHGLFYPTFKSMVDVTDELKRGSRSLTLLEFAVRNTERYERQMCVWLDGWSRFWGPKTIRGVAFTGSDPYWDTGTDSAVLFDARLTGRVYANTESKQQKMLKEIKDAKKFTGSVEGVEYQAVVSPDRAVSSYLAKIENVVVVTNSLAQLEKIAQAAKSKQAAIADLDEYAFFRSRYPLDEDNQTAFLVMTDAAIRRWCSPHWRIGAARRTMAATVLSQMQAEYLDNPAKFDLNKAQKTAQDWAKDFGSISITEAGVTSSVYGNLRFMTPILELSIQKISERERAQYGRFRDSYQRQWGDFLNPIGVSLLLNQDVVDIDLTMRSQITADGEPLRQLGDLTRKMLRDPRAGATTWPGSKLIIRVNENEWPAIEPPMADSDVRLTGARVLRLDITCRQETLRAKTVIER